MLLKTTGLLLSAMLLFTGCSGTTSVEGPSGESLASFKTNKTQQTGNCIKMVEAMIVKANAGTITQTEFDDFTRGGLLGCRDVYLPDEIFTIVVNEPIDYLNAEVKLGSEYARLNSIKLWFMHQLIQYPDMKDPNIRHETWTTFRSPTVSVLMPNGGDIKFTRAAVTNLPFVNPIERVKANAPSMVETFTYGQREVSKLTVHVKDPNDYATTWVGEIQYRITTEARRFNIDGMYSILRSNEHTLAEMRGFQDLNNVTKYESVRRNLEYLRNIIATL